MRTLPRILETQSLRNGINGVRFLSQDSANKEVANSYEDEEGKIYNMANNYVNNLYLIYCQNFVF